MMSRNQEASACSVAHLRRNGVNDTRRSAGSDRAGGGGPIHYHGPHELCIFAGGPQNRLILSQNSTFIQL